MKIVNKRSRKSTLTRLIWFLIAAALLTMVAMVSLSGVQLFLLSGWEVIQNIASLDGGEPALPALAIDMAFTEYDQILGQRSEALSSGVVLLGEEDFVPADMTFEDETVPVRMRLQQGPAAHLGEAEKWNFDVRTRDDQTLAGLQRFYLVDPADNNWLYEQAFDEGLRREGLMAGRTDFVRLFLNGDYRGIYALQEGFAPALMAVNDRPQGVIVEFDADPLWRSMAYHDGSLEAAIHDPITNLDTDDFRFFEVDTFRDRNIADDPELAAQKDQAIGLLRGFQSGELSAPEVFDVEKYGRFLALVDLWAATPATFLTNLRYYFNPQTGLLEPIAFNANPFGKAERLSMNATFHDPALQKAYLNAAQRMADPAYLDAYVADMTPELETMQQALAAEFEQPLPWEKLADRQEMIRRSLYPLQPVFAYLGPPTLSQEGIIQVDVANVLNLPVEILGFDIDGATFLEAEPGWLVTSDDELIALDDDQLIMAPQTRAGEPGIGYVRFQIPLMAIVERDDELDFLHDMDLQVATRIVGLGDVHLTPARPGYPDPLTAPGQGETTP
jgi:hypothetical protein